MRENGHFIFKMNAVSHKNKAGEKLRKFQMKYTNKLKSGTRLTNCSYLQPSFTKYSVNK